MKIDWVRLIENIVGAVALYGVIFVGFAILLDVVAPHFDTGRFFDYRSDTSRAMQIGSFITAYVMVVLWRSGREG
jgi:hypothetical protein